MCPKPNKFKEFGDIPGPKPYEFIGFGDIPGPTPYQFIGFGDIHGPDPQSEPAPSLRGRPGQTIFDGSPRLIQSGGQVKSADDGLGFRRLGFSDLIENLSFWGSGRALGAVEPSKKVGGEAPHLFGWF